ncbi:Leucine rich repeat 4 [Artemisia annua]|uniref:Leucine rich repeat 4 n=1 Tax=Artemisia annua TaxID=35608 RepID=A0A2U1MB07_ARTAN|nr:Leucine rich repeat 4 [Artemisia annua]
MSFLRSEFASDQLPHGNLKSGNVHIGSHYEPLRSDYAYHPSLKKLQPRPQFGSEQISFIAVLNTSRGDCI